MKKRIAFLAVLLVVATLFSLVSCSQEPTDAPDGFTLAVNEGADYLFYYPSQWLLDRCDAGMTSVYVSEMDFSNVSVTAFTANAQYATLQNYAEEYYFKQFEGNFANLKIERNQDGSLKRENMKIDGYDAMAVKFSAEFSGELYHFRAWMISGNGYIYTILYTAKGPLYESHLEEATAIANHFRFK